MEGSREGGGSSRGESSQAMANAHPGAAYTSSSAAAQQAAHRFGFPGATPADLALSLSRGDHPLSPGGHFEFERGEIRSSFPASSLPFPGQVQHQRLSGSVFPDTAPPSISPLARTAFPGAGVENNGFVVGGSGSNQSGSPGAMDAARFSLEQSRVYEYERERRRVAGLWQTQFGAVQPGGALPMPGYPTGKDDASLFGLMSGVHRGFALENNPIFRERLATSSPPTSQSGVRHYNHPSAAGFVLGERSPFIGSPHRSSHHALSSSQPYADLHESFATRSGIPAAAAETDDRNSLGSAVGPYSGHFSVPSFIPLGGGPNHVYCNSVSVSSPGLYDAPPSSVTAFSSSRAPSADRGSDQTTTTSSTTASTAAAPPPAHSHFSPGPLQRFGIDEERKGQSVEGSIHHAFPQNRLHDALPSPWSSSGGGSSRGGISTVNSQKQADAFSPEIQIKSSPSTREEKDALRGKREFHNNPGSSSTSSYNHPEGSLASYTDICLPGTEREVTVSPRDTSNFTSSSSQCGPVVEASAGKNDVPPTPHHQGKFHHSKMGGSVAGHGYPHPKARPDQQNGRPPHQKSLSPPAMKGSVDTGVGTGVSTGVGPGVSTGVGTGVSTGVGPGVSTGVGTGVSTGVGTGVSTGVGPGVSAGVGPGVSTGVGTGVGTGVSTGVGPGVSSGVGTGTWAMAPRWRNSGDNNSGQYGEHETKADFIPTKKPPFFKHRNRQRKAVYMAAPNAGGGHRKSQGTSPMKVGGAPHRVQDAVVVLSRVEDEARSRVSSHTQTSSIHNDLNPTIISATIKKEPLDADPYDSSTSEYEPPSPDAMPMRLSMRGSAHRKKALRPGSNKSFAEHSDNSLPEEQPPRIRLIIKKERLTQENSRTTWSTTGSIKTAGKKRQRRLPLGLPRKIQNRRGNRTCPICQKTFSRADSLTCHMRVHTGDRPYKCDECEATYKVSSHLTDHIRSKHTNSRPYECARCGKTFTYSTARRRHEKICGMDLAQRIVFRCAHCEKGFVTSKGYTKHEENCSLKVTGGTSDTPFKCTPCGRAFANLSSLDRHQRFFCARVPQRGHYVCTECGKTFQKRNRYVTHTWRHTGVRPYHCPRCPLRFYDSATLRRHLDRHEGNRKFSCGACPAAFYMKRCLILHVMRSHRGGVVPYRCKDCGLCFSSGYQLSRHARRVHHQERGYKCMLCFKGFSQCSSWMRHMRRHALQPGKPRAAASKQHACKLCDATFLMKDLHAHAALHHPGLTLADVVDTQIAKCDICCKNFSCQESLRLHRVRHAGIKTFHCDKCPMSFVLKSGLALHQRKHTDLRPHACLECGKTFRWRTSVSHHMRTHHAPAGGPPNGGDVKAFACEECPKRFKRQICLNVHMKKHRQVMPCICSECGKGFVDLCRLKIHMSTHEGPKPFTCETCRAGFYYQYLLDDHVKKRHSNGPKQSWLCSECGKSLCRKDALAKHMALHTKYQDGTIPKAGRRKANKYLQANPNLHLHPNPTSSDSMQPDLHPTSLPSCEGGVNTNNSLPEEWRQQLPPLPPNPHHGNPDPFEHVQNQSQGKGGLPGGEWRQNLMNPDPNNASSLSFAEGALRNSSGRPEESWRQHNPPFNLNNANHQQQRLACDEAQQRMGGRGAEDWRQNLPPNVIPNPNNPLACEPPRSDRFSPEEWKPTASQLNFGAVPLSGNGNSQQGGGRKEGLGDESADMMPVGIRVTRPGTGGQGMLGMEEPAPTPYPFQYNTYIHHTLPWPRPEGH